MPNTPTNLSAQFTSWRAALNASATLTNVNETVPTADPTGTVQEKFRLKLGPAVPKLKDMHGGSGDVEYETDVLLEITWDPEGIEATVWNVVVDDTFAAIAVIQKASNRVTKVLRAVATGRGNVREISTKEIRAEVEFTVIHREAQDLT